MVTSHDMTLHDMTWHDISRLTTLPHLTSPDNQPQYCISPRSQPHNITYHITAHHITTTDAPRKHNQPPPKRHHHERPKAGAHKNLGLGIAVVGRGVQIIYVCFSLVYSLFPVWKLPPPVCRALLVYIQSQCHDLDPSTHGS